MKYNNISLLFSALILMISLVGCEDTIWPEVQKIDKTEYTGLWNSYDYRTVNAYKRLQDSKTFNYSFTDTTYTDSTQMSFQFGIAGSSGIMVEDSVIITLTQTLNGVAKAPVIKTGYFTIGETAGSDYTKKALFLNIWDKTSNIHGTISDPYTTYAILKNTGDEMELTWTNFNNTAQNSIKYKVVLKK